MRELLLLKPTFWLAFAKFAEDVMRSKEEAEGAREVMYLSPSTYDPG